MLVKIKLNDIDNSIKSHKASIDAGVGAGDGVCLDGDSVGIGDGILPLSVDKVIVCCHFEEVP